LTAAVDGAALPAGLDERSPVRPRPPASHATTHRLTGERAATRGRSAIEGGDEHAGMKRRASRTDANLD
jgi:hypothetical protein